MGENEVWQLDSGRRVLGEKRGELVPTFAKHCHSLNVASLSNGLNCRFLD